jgi:antitoxin component YwqK of YwqJK toxin-antitoxin module
MNPRLLIPAFLLTVSVWVSGQTSPQINLTDSQGKKQGHWIKKYPNENIMYEGNFQDDHPVGELKRYNEDQSLKSILTYSNDGRKADAVMYHPNGFISARGLYVDQKKEGKWQFYSSFISGYLLSKVNYSGNQKNGLSVNYYPDSTIAEKVTYVKDIKHGDWMQYYPSGALKLKSHYTNGKLDGKFEMWFENGSIEFSGQYKNDNRDGRWIIFNDKGTIKYELTYIDGVTKDRQMDIDESDFIDSLEKNIGKIADPEKTGINRE